MVQNLESHCVQELTIGRWFHIAVIRHMQQRCNTIAHWLFTDLQQASSITDSYTIPGHDNNIHGSQRAPSPVLDNHLHCIIRVRDCKQQFNQF